MKVKAIRVVSLTVVIMLCTVIPLCGKDKAEAAGKPMVLKMGHVYQPSHPMHGASLAAAEYIEKVSNSRIKIDVFPASQLGKETALVEQIRIGGVDIMLAGQLFSSADYSPLAIGAAPYIFRDREHALKYRKSDLLKELMAGWNNATGAHLLSAGYFGAFCVSSNRPIVTLEDIKGMKVRVPDTPLFMAFPRAVGANPTPVAFAEVYLALQQGVVEASTNPLPVTYAKKFYEVQKYFALTNHLIEYVFFTVGDHVWKKLSDQEKAWMQKTADIFADQSTEALVKQEDTLRVKMEKEGMLKFTEPDVDAFRKASRSAIEEQIKQGLYTRDMVERIQQIK